MFLSDELPCFDQQRSIVACKGPFPPLDTSTKRKRVHQREYTLA